MPYKPKKIKKVLIANRGEIAVRIIQAAHELNMEAVAIFTDADKGNLASQLADEAIHIGENLAHKSYLDMDKVIEAAKQSKADAIHPGYGFLSENAEFAKKVTESGIIFVGPSSDIIKTMGDKAQAILKAKEAGVPTIPGSKVLDSKNEALLEAEKIVTNPKANKIIEIINSGLSIPFIIFIISLPLIKYITKTQKFK